ncbi:MAG: hypothetical protein HYW25_01720 [Candidatus Aenigmarchaeota archaeon]|nr:hypothetical protein [Candidatus Aenigmarchaeota archaeon]
MKLVEVLKMRSYLLLAAASSVVFAFIYIYTQVLFNIANFDIWISIIPWYNAILFVIFAVLFGITVSYQVYTWRQPKACPINMKAKGTGVSGAGYFIGLLIAQCPACASLGALFLPVSAFTFFVQFSWLLNLVSIGLLLFVLNYLGGFRK